MTGICGNSNTLDGTPYFKGLSQVHDINEALNELLIQIDANVNPNAKSLNIMWITSKKNPQRIPLILGRN